MGRLNRCDRYGLCAAKRKSPGSIRFRNGPDGPRDPQRIAMAGTRPARGCNPLVSGPPPSRRAPPDSRRRDSQPRAALLHDIGRTPSVLQDRAYRPRRRDAFRSGTDVRPALDPTTDDVPERLRKERRLKWVRAPLTGDRTARRRPFGLPVLSPGPGEVGLRCRKDRAEDPNDAADLARLAAVVGQKDADHSGYDCSVHQVLPGHRGGGPERSAKDDVDDHN